MIYIGKYEVVNDFDIVVRVGKFPTQGKKIVIQKGSTIISVPAEDVHDLCQVIQRLANFKYETKCIPQFDDAINPVEIADGCNDYCVTYPAR